MSRAPMATISAVLAAYLGLWCPSAHGAAPPEGDPAAAYRLAPGDRIALTVFGEPEFSGEFQVEASGAVAVPFAGDVAVAGRTIAETRAAIAQRLAAGVLKNPAVDVRVREFRPIYVTGDVRVAGSYAYRFGATVLSAVAMAGGYRVPSVSRATLAAEYLAADERYRDLRVQRLALLARQGRLAAQISGAQTFEVPAPPGDADSADLADLVGAEREAFAAARDALASEIALLTAQKPRIDREISAVMEQKAVEEQQATAIHQQSQQYVGLVKQGLGLATQDLQFKLEETTRREEIMRLAADVSRLEMDSGDVDVRIAEVRATFKRQTGTELEEVRQRLKQVEVSLRVVGRIVAIRRAQVGGGAGSAEDGRVLYVLRTMDGHAAEMPATEAMSLLPGDVVEVKSAAETLADEPDGEAPSVAGTTGGP